MMDHVRFAKGHGTGNDFIVLPDLDAELPLTPEVVAALCDRRRGIGADGVLRVVRAAKHPDGVRHAGEAEWFMDYWNADGSLAEMCGNGARVFARYLVRIGLSLPGTVPLATRAGLRVAQVEGRMVTVDMGTTTIGPVSAAAIGGWTFPGTTASTGNPHLVCPVADVDALDLSHPPRVDPRVFPDGVNVEFIAPASVDGPADLHVRMRVFERGSGETLSCGTGACAAAAVALLGAGLERGVVTVDVPGGRLEVTIDERTTWLAGPAVIVAEGTFLC